MNKDKVSYVFTLIGGGWGYSHDMYVITKDDKVYYTNKFNEDNLLDCNLEYMCDLYDSSRSNFWISSCYRKDKDGNQIEERKYLFDLLNDDGKIDFDNFKVEKYAIMDAIDLTLYKNVDDELKELVHQGYCSDSLPAVQYVLAICSKRSR